MQSRLKNIKILILIFLMPSLVSAQDVYQHLIMYGQSLSVGAQSYPVITKSNISGNYMIGNQIWINYNNSGSKIFNPLVGTTVGGTPTEGIMNRTAGVVAECPLYGLTNHLQQKTAGVNKYLASSCGYHGRTIEQLSKGSNDSELYNYFLSAISSAKTYAQGNSLKIECPAIFWLQGENNYVNTYPGYTAGSTCTTDKTIYQEWLVRLKNDMQQDIMTAYGQTEKPLFITYQVGAQFIKNKEASISMSQLEASNKYSDIICAGPVYPMPDRGGHLDPNGYRWYGEMMAKVFYKTKILGETFKPLQPFKIFRTSDNNKLKIQFLVPQLPLVLDDKLVQKQTNYGFDLYVGGSQKTITDVSVNGDCVYITSSVSLQGQDIEIIYAGQNTNGHGNLRDSDAYPSLFTYIDLDGKDESGNYIYPRDAAETTLRPSYEPRDDNGIIYGKPYPLYNFGVTFYYSLSSVQDSMTVPSLDNTIDIVNLGIVHEASGNLAVEIQNAIGSKDANDTKFLSITGSANLSYEDCRTVVSVFPNLRGLDLSKAKFENNAIPDASSGLGAFELLPVADVRLPSTITRIGDKAFRSCTHLTSVTPYGATIGIEAFASCTSLRAVYFNAPALPAGTVSDAFASGLKIYVPYGKRTDYSSVLSSTTVEDGTVGNEYKIETANDLDAVRLYGTQTGAIFSLLQDIDFSGWAENRADADIRSGGWSPLGDETNPFVATFLGNGYFIQNIWMKRPTQNNLGLFAVCKAANVSKLGILSDNEQGGITGNQNVGAIVGQVTGTSDTKIEQCYVNGNFTAGKNVGSLVGMNYGKTLYVTQCYAEGSVTGTDGCSGLVGNTYGSGSNVVIDESYSLTNVNALATAGSGGGLLGGFSYSSSSAPTTTIVTVKKSGALAKYINGKGFGRLVGYEKSTTFGNYENNFAFEGMLLNNVSVSSGTASNKDGQNKTIEELVSQSTYVSWNFSDVWRMGNDDYALPVLKNLTLSKQPITQPVHLIGTSSIPVIQEHDVAIYPNPFSERVFVRNNIGGDPVFIYDYTGRLVMKSDQSEINLSTYPQGIYLFKIGNKAVKMVKK